METPDIIVSLDIGTTKICAIAARKNEKGKIEILGMGKAPSRGLNRGVIANINLTVQSIEKAISIVEEKIGMELKNVSVGIAGQHIKSLQHRATNMRDTPTEEITKKDIEKLANDMYKLLLPPGDEIIHVIPQEYTIDNEENIKEPIGMSGGRIEAECHIITGQVTATKNIHKCVEKVGLEVEDLILEPIASCAAVLDDEELEAGVALVDIGGGTTDLAIFQDGIIRHTAVIPLGGNIVTDDIKQGCQVMRNQAEILKVKFGAAMALEAQENEVVSIPGLRGREPKQISRKNLSHIIQARMEEIMDAVLYEIKRSGYEEKLIAGVVVTGGGAQLKFLKDLIEGMSGMDCRVGIPNEKLEAGYPKELDSPMYATSVGLAIKGLKNKETLSEDKDENTKLKDNKQVTTEKKGVFSKFGSIFGDWFNSSEDEDNDDL